MANKYFNTFKSPNERKLFKKLHSEYIENFGINVMFIPREINNIDMIYKESSLDKFEDAFEITAYLENYDDYSDGAMDLYSKFGLTVNDGVNLIIEKEKFKEYSNGYEPKEGDLIYIPQFEKTLLEIIQVDDDKSPFYWLQDRYTFRFNCKPFVYSGEEMSTEIPEIDNLETEVEEKIFDQNDEFENKEDEVIDWSEDNPFLT